MPRLGFPGHPTPESAPHEDLSVLRRADRGRRHQVRLLPERPRTGRSCRPAAACGPAAPRTPPPTPPPQPPPVAPPPQGQPPPTPPQGATPYGQNPRSTPPDQPAYGQPSYGQQPPSGTGYAAAPQAPPPPSAPAAAAAIVGEGALHFSHSGERYILGYGTDFFGIWDRLIPGPAALRFPRTDDGWNQAWAQFAAREPRAMAVPTRGMAPPDVRVTGREFRDPHKLATWAWALVGAASLMALITLPLRIAQLNTLHDYLNGLATLTDVNDATSRASGVGVFAAIASAAAIVVWLVLAVPSAVEPPGAGRPGHEVLARMGGRLVVHPRRLVGHALPHHARALAGERSGGRRGGLGHAAADAAHPAVVDVLDLRWALAIISGGDVLVVGTRPGDVHVHARAAVAPCLVGHLVRRRPTSWRASSPSW